MSTTDLVESESQPKLVRELGRLDATMIVMGSMIGSGIFLTSAESARLVGSPGWLLAASAVLQLLAGWAFVANTWGRVKER